MSASFEIEDASGGAMVLPEGAIIEGIESVDRTRSSATLRNGSAICRPRPATS
jgi:hypothetical protein